MTKKKWSDLVMVNVQIYEEEEFKLGYGDIYEKALEETKLKGIDLNDYYFSQYIFSDYQENKKFGELLYILDDGTDDVSFNLEIEFNENEEIISVEASVTED